MATDEVKTVEQDKPQNSDPATSGLLYAPTGPRRRRNRKPRPLIAYRKSEGGAEASSEPKSAESVESDDLDEVFQYRDDDGHNNERAIRAASFLLDWATAEGNEEVDAVLAQGISRALNLAADNMAQEARRRAREQQENGKA